MPKMKAAIFSNDVSWIPDGHVIDKVYANGRREQLAELTELYPEIITSENMDAHLDRIQDIEVIFSTWGMLVLDESQVRKLPSLKALFYAAGETGYFRTPFVECGVTVCSATAANAVPVAEFALAQVLLAGAGYFRNSRACVDAWHAEKSNNAIGPGNYGGRVSILGNGAISNELQKFLSAHHLDVVVVPSRAENRTVSLEEAFATSFAVVNLFPDRDDNADVLNGGLFERMGEGSVFINVGRGRQVNEDDLVRIMKVRPKIVIANPYRVRFFHFTPILRQ